MLTTTVHAAVAGEPVLWLPVPVTIVLSHCTTSVTGKGRQHRILFSASEGDVVPVAEQRIAVVSVQGGGVKLRVFLTREAGNVDVLLECSYIKGKQSYSNIIILRSRTK